LICEKVRAERGLRHHARRHGSDLAPTLVLDDNFSRLQETLLLQFKRVEA